MRGQTLAIGPAKPRQTTCIPVILQIPASPNAFDISKDDRKKPDPSRRHKGVWSACLGRRTTGLDLLSATGGPALMSFKGASFPKDGWVYLCRADDKRGKPLDFMPSRRGKKGRPTCRPPGSPSARILNSRSRCSCGHGLVKGAVARAVSGDFDGKVVIGAFVGKLALCYSDGP